MQLGQARSAKGFRVYKDIRGSFAPSQESEAARAIESSHLCALEWSGWTDDDMGASRRHFRRVLSGRRIH